MIKLKLFIISGFFFVLGMSNNCISSVRHDHQVYEYWLRSWMRGWTDNSFSTIRPVNENYLSLAVKFDEKNEAEYQYDHTLYMKAQDEFSASTQNEFYGKSRWREAIGKLGISRQKINWIYHSGAWLWQSEKNGVFFGLNPVTGIETIYDQSFADAAIIRTTAGVEILMKYESQWFTKLRFKDLTEYSADGKRRKPYRGAAYTTALPGVGATSFDQTTAYVQYIERGITLRLGRDKISWGPTITDGLFLSGEAPPFPFIELTAKIPGRLCFSFIHATLDPSPVANEVEYIAPSGKERIVKSKKYVAAHRIEWKPTDLLSFGFSESVIYGERGVQLGYIIPINIYWSENHHQDRDDNVLWGMDFQWLPKKGFRIWGEYLLDEGNTGKLLKNNLHNRTAFRIGYDWIDIFNIENVGSSLNYTHIRPYVYTHWYPINIYSHHGFSLGSQLKPNSDRWELKVDYRPAAYVQLELLNRYTRHSESTRTNVNGGEITDSPQKGQQNAPMLTGSVSKRSEHSISVEYEILDYLFSNFRFGLIREEDRTDLLISLGLLWHLRSTS